MLPPQDTTYRLMGVVSPNRLAASGQLALFVTCLPPIQTPDFPDGQPSGLCTDVIGAAPRAHKYNSFVVDHLGMPDSAGLATEPAEPSKPASPKSEPRLIYVLVASDRLALASLVAAAAMAAAAACTEMAAAAVCRDTAATGQLL